MMPIRLFCEEKPGSLLSQVGQRAQQAKQTASKATSQAASQAAAEAEGPAEDFVEAVDSTAKSFFQVRYL